MFNRKYLLTLVTMTSLALYIAGCGKKSDEETTPTDTKGTPTMGGGGSAYDPAMGTATVNGKVAFTGAAPEKSQIKMNSEPTCHAQHKDNVFAEEGEVNANGTLPYVFVYVKSGADKWTFTPPSEPKTIDQKGCRYIPHVFGIQTNQTLKILNSDPILHNIHSYTKDNEPFNIGMPNVGSKDRKFTKPEVMIPIKCDVHKWMVSYVGVVPHPFYAVTGADGTFSLKGVPPGQYTIEAWHEKHGTKTETVTVGDKETKDVTFTFSG